MKIIGLTGGVGAGKSALLSYMNKQHGCFILRADEVSHDIMKKGGSVYEELLVLLGRYPKGELLSSSGEILREEMAERIFSSSELRQEVNALIHPAVRREILGTIQRLKELEEKESPDAPSFFVLESALLLESGYREIVDEMWYIYCAEEIRRERLKQSRGYSDEKITGIMASQLQEEEFRAGADVVIDNSRSLEEAFLQVDEALKRA